MNEKALKVLEYPKIIQKLTDYAASQPGKQLCRDLTPSSDPGTIRRMQTETSDAVSRLLRKGNISFSGLTDIRGSLRRLEIGSSLNIEELLRVCRLLETTLRVKSWSRSARNEAENAPEDSLESMFSGLQPLSPLSAEISRCILSEDEIADDASPGLRQVRRQIHQTNDRIRVQLNSLVNGSARTYLQDAVVTQRNGRFCLPVKAEYRGQVPGMIHDQSSTGSTLFIEPMSVVKLNNDLRELEIKEEKEIEIVLANLSSLVAAETDALNDNILLLTELDFIFARAQLSLFYRGSEPDFNEEGRIRIKKGRHPLIDPKKVVPVDIRIGEDFTMLVISGPNTGGKTVSLKTVGLFTLLGQSGLHIPASDHSELSVFDEVYADIGDEQSIEQSLSTFSAHMTNIIRILNIADDKSLILIDELGAGTDPVEGAALAISIIEAMRTKGTRVMATTHYAELKAYAIQTVGVENACCEFDVATLRPTYRLLIGVPGRSNAFAISARLGMPANIVEHAKELVSDESTMFEEVVSRLEESRRKMEDERESAEQLRLKAQNMEKEAEALRDRAEKDAKHEIERARMEAAELVQKTRREAQSLLDELEDLRRNKQKLLTAEQKARLKAGIRDMEKASDPVHERRIDEDYVLPRPLQVGDTVLIYDIDKIATVLDVPKNGDQILVQAGIIKTRVPLKNLRLTDQKPKEKKKAAGGHRTVTKKMDSAPARNEVDVRGMNLEEALMEVDAFIDHALMHNLNMLTIIHGKGTGILRNGIQQHLRRHKAVKSFRLGVYGEGESGVTIVELK